MRVKLWGTRGSVPTPAAQNTRYGGNTSCVEVCTGEETIILDCGIGLHWLGQDLLRSREGGRAHILLSHTHWDHIQGIPFFQPMLSRDWRFTILGCAGNGSLQDLLLRQMDQAYCPVPNFFDDEVGARLTIQDIDEEPLHIGATRVTPRRVNHMTGTACLGYRLEADGSSLAYIPDVEYLEDSHRIPALELAAGVDLLIHGAYCSDAEYGTARGRGHASDTAAIDLAREAGAARLLLFHHHPDHDDDTLDAVVEGHRHCGLPVEAAAEGTVYVLGKD